MLQKNGEILITTYDSTDLNEIGMLIISVPRKDINTENTAKQLKLLNKVEKRKNQLIIGSCDSHYIWAINSLSTTFLKIYKKPPCFITKRF